MTIWGGEDELDSAGPELTSRRARPRPKRLQYAAPVDPAMSALGWRFAALTYASVLLPLVGVLLPRDAPTRWNWLAGVVVFAAATGALNLILLRRMVRAGGFNEPPAWVPLAQAVAATIVAGGVNYSLSGASGVYRPMIIMPTILITVLGTRFMIVIAGGSALATLVISSYAQGAAVEHLPALTMSYAATWGVLIVMVRALSSTALSSVRLTDGIVDAAAIAAHAERLDEGIERLLPVIGTWASAERVTAFEFDRAGDEAGRLMSHWPTGTIPRVPPTTAELNAACDSNGAAVRGDRALISAEVDEVGTVALVIDGIERRRLDSLTYQFQLQKMSRQLASLLSRSHQIQQLESLGMTDSLTGLPNRRSLEGRLGLERSAARPPDHPLSLAMLDLDDFKAFNDTHGHPAGDELLRQFATALRATVRGSDFVARYGGEEFCLLLPDTATDGACTLIDQMRSSLRSLEPVGLPAFSAGIATWDGYESRQDLLRRADEALYQAKAQGKDRSIVAMAPPPLGPPTLPA